MSVTIPVRSYAVMHSFLSNFCSRQLEQFTTEYHYNDLYQRGLQVLAKAGLAMEW